MHTRKIKAAAKLLVTVINQTAQTHQSRRRRVVLKAGIELREEDAVAGVPTALRPHP